MGGALCDSHGAMPDRFKDKLVRWRGRLMQKEAADLLGVPLATLRKWEYGKRTPKAITLCEIERRMNQAEKPK